MSGSAGLFSFSSSGAQRWAKREMGNTKKNTATLIGRVTILLYLAVYEHN